VKRSTLEKTISEPLKARPAEREGRRDASRPSHIDHVSEGERIPFVEEREEKGRKKED